MELDLVVLALATWRISSFISSEDGLFDWMARLRVFLGVRYDEHGEPYGTNELAHTLLCTWCVSPIVGLALMAVWIFAQRTAFVFSLPLALSAVTIALDARGIRYRKRGR